MKKAAAITIALLLIVFQFGCERPSYVRLTGFYEPYGILGVNMPYTDTLNDLQFDQVLKVEEDSFGRRYFIYNTYSSMWMCQLEIHVISQKTTGEDVYYYEDLCYMLKQPDSDSPNVEEVEAFKARNDWNLPLDENMMSCTKLKEYHKNIANETQIRETVLQYLGLPENSVFAYKGMEIYNGNLQIFLVQAAENKEEYSRLENCHIMLLTADDGCEVLYSEVFPRISECGQNVISFRENCMTILENAK